MSEEASQSLLIAAVYIRVSTDKQEELSPDAQKRLIYDYAKRNHILVSEEYTFLEEGGISGKKAEKRPQFQKMIALAKSQEHPFDLILVWKFSRFARNQEESIVYKSMLKKDKVDVVSVSEPLVEGPFGSLIERIIEWMDEYYSIRLSGEVFRGMSENAMRGNFQSSPPLGYSIPYHKAEPVIVEEQAKIVKLIFQKYVEERMSVANITYYLNQLGLKTARGKQFEKRSVEYILQNPVYKGYTRWNRTHNETKTIKNKEEWIIRKGHHPAIISEELFEQAQMRYQSEYHPRNVRASASYKHWLSGMLKCSACGRTLSYSRVYNNEKNYSFFQCYGYSKKKCMVSHGISERRIVPVILNSLQEAAFTEAEFEVEITNSAGKEQEENTVSLIQMQIDKLRVKEERIWAAYMDGVDTLEEYKRNKQLLLKERETFEKQFAVLSVQEKKTPDMADMKKRISDVIMAIESDDFTTEQKSEAIRSIIKKIVYDRPNEKITVYYRYS